MGIPKFYRWISERYPCLSEKIREYQIPDFDNLYLDMNGIIHSCSHPNDDDVHLRIPEDVIFREIFRYIDFLFKMIKPRKVFFMAIDGVAPRAKMNQQRGRRFRSAKLASDQEAEAVKKGEKLPSEERFDSNCITPGTAFMARLHEQLQYFVKVKVTTDPLWQREGLTVYLSGHDVPGEGEHKVMDFIRHIRCKADYDPETRHCLYGLDADLIMLGLSTHELHFSLLREEVKFGNFKKKRGGPRDRNQKSDQDSSPAKTVPIDLKNASLFQEIENTEVTTVEVKHDDAVIATSFIKGEVTYSGAIKATDKPVTADVVRETNTAEDSLAPDGTKLGKDVYHPPIPEKTTFLLLHLSLLRDYIDEEFSPLRQLLKGTAITYDLERIIDDWILMSILVGNDFVPNLPHLHINTNALPMLYEMYMKVLPQLDGYLNENGMLRLDRFEVFLQELSQFDVDHFRQTYDDMKYMASKTGKNIVLGDNMLTAFEFDDDGDAKFKEDALEEDDSANKNSELSELQALINRTEEDVFGEVEEKSKFGEALEVFPESDGLFDTEDSPEIRLEFAQSKRHYYMTKMDFKDVRAEVEKLCVEYVRAIQWVLLYYYKGVSSWCWYYPAHYAPYASDLRNFKDLKITFDKGQPFKPFEQLLAVLPSHSKRLLPDCYQGLMTSKASPIIEYYPEKFEQDLNGKKQDWEAVILIPFIDEKLLLNAMESESSRLTTDEVHRNLRGKLLLYSYSEEDTGPIVPPDYQFPRLSSSHVRIEGMSEVDYDPVTLPRGLHPRAKLHAVYHGFPTLKSLPYKSYLKEIQVKVFEMPARDVSMVLDLSKSDKERPSEETEPQEDKLASVRKLIGKQIWVNWPHLTPALVCGVSDKTVKYMEKNKSICVDTDHSAAAHLKVVDGLMKRHLACKGIKLGNVEVVIWARLMEGRKLRCDDTGKIQVDNLWGSVNHPFALQTSITSEEQVKIFSMESSAAKHFADLFRRGDRLFCLENKRLGAEGVVVGHDTQKVRVIVELATPVYRNIGGEANKNIGRELDKWMNDNYFSTYDAARMCYLDAFTFSRVTGSIMVIVEKGTGNKKPKGFRGQGKSKSGQPVGPDDDEDLYIAQETKKVNIGLDLKFNKRNQKARGYTMKSSSDKLDKWSYSLKCVNLVKRYVELFPDFIDFLKYTANDRGRDMYTAKEIFPGDPVGRVREIQNWVDSLGLRNTVQRVDFTSDIMDDDEIQIVWDHILKCKLHAGPSLKKTVAVKPSFLHKPGTNKGCVAPVLNQECPHLLDRIVCIDPSAGLPLGTRGTVVGLQEPQVKDYKDAVEESFKATNATVLKTLIILPDPQPDVFDKASENYISSEVKNIPASNELQEMLGIKTSNIQVENSPTEQAEDKFRPVPKLVKLFPYQVICISNTERQEYKEEENAFDIQAALNRGVDKFHGKPNKPNWKQESRNYNPNKRNEQPQRNSSSKDGFNFIKFVKSSEAQSSSAGREHHQQGRMDRKDSNHRVRHTEQTQPQPTHILKRPHQEQSITGINNPIFNMLQKSLDKQKHAPVPGNASLAELLNVSSTSSLKNIAAGSVPNQPKSDDPEELLKKVQMSLPNPEALLPKKTKSQPKQQGRQQDKRDQHAGQDSQNMRGTIPAQQQASHPRPHHPHQHPQPLMSMPAYGRPGVPQPFFALNNAGMPIVFPNGNMMPPAHFVMANHMQHQQQPPNYRGHHNQRREGPPRDQRHPRQGSTSLTSMIPTQAMVQGSTPKVVAASSAHEIDSSNGVAQLLHKPPFSQATQVANKEVDAANADLQRLSLSGPQGVAGNRLGRNGQTVDHQHGRTQAAAQKNSSKSRIAANFGGTS